MDKKDLEKMFPSLRKKKTVFNRVKDSASEFLNKQVYELERARIKFLTDLGLASEVPISSKKAAEVLDTYKNIKGAEPVTLYSQAAKDAGIDLQPSIPFSQIPKDKAAFLLEKLGVMPGPLEKFKPDYKRLRYQDSQALSSEQLDASPAHSPSKRTESGRAIAEAYISPIGFKSVNGIEDLIWPGSILTHEIGHIMDDQTTVGRQALLDRSTRYDKRRMDKFGGEVSRPTSYREFYGPKAKEPDLNTYYKNFFPVVDGKPTFKGYRDPVSAALFGLETVFPKTFSSPQAQISTGAVAEMLSPENINLLRTEIRANKMANILSKKANLPISNVNRLTGLASYASVPLATGLLKGGAFATLGMGLNKAADFGVDMLEHGVIDPLARRMVGGDTNFESSLRQYGYDPSKYDIGFPRTVDGPLRHVPIIGHILSGIGREEIPINRVEGLSGKVRNFMMPK